MEKEYWIYDLEQFPNFHSAYFISKTNKREKFFIIHKDRDDRDAYIKFLKTQVKGLIGFNNINYDSKLLNVFIQNVNDKDLLHKLFSKSYEIVHSDEQIFEDDLIPQLDLFKIHHYNNKARRTSLKWIEFYLKMDNIMDLPLDPMSEVTPSDFSLIRYYNRHDVLATKLFYEYTESTGAIELRRNITKQYGFNALNLSDVTIGSKINQIYYSNITGIPFKEYKHKRTYRSVIAVNDCIPSYAKFETETMKKAFSSFCNEVIRETKGGLNYDIKLGPNIFSLKKGGLHSHDKPMIIEPRDDEILCEVDVDSMYPNIIYHNKLYPKHLGEEWLKGYSMVISERLEAKSKKDNTKSDALKLALNGGGFGKTNDQFSWMYDPLTNN